MQVGLGVVFVHQGDVIKHVLLFNQHLAHALVDDDRHLAGKRRVVGLAIGDGGRHQVAGAVLVLQTFAPQGGAACSGTKQEAPRPLVRRGPNGVAHPLKTKHGVVNVKRQHGQAVHAVAGGGGRPTGNGTRFADAFLQNLPVHGFAVTQHRANVLGLVLLPHAGINPHLLEQIGHAKSACFVSHDGHQACAQQRVFEQLAQHAHKGHGGGHFFVIGLQGK